MCVSFDFCLVFFFATKDSWLFDLYYVHLFPNMSPVVHDEADNNKNNNNNALPIIPLWINGEPVPITETDSLFPVTNALENKTLHRAVSASTHSAKAACDAAALALKSWRKTSVAHRRALLLKVADRIEAGAAEIAECQVRETSCQMQFAGFNVKAGVVGIREIAAATSELRGTVAQRGEGLDGEEKSGLTVVVREPVGVVLVVPPLVSLFSFPFSSSSSSSFEM